MPLHHPTVVETLVLDHVPVAVKKLQGTADYILRSGGKETSLQKVWPCFRSAHDESSDTKPRVQWIAGTSVSGLYFRQHKTAVFS
jgi:hypothetical protein